jgi:hypothetical protein
MVRLCRDVRGSSCAAAKLTAGGDPEKSMRSRPWNNNANLLPNELLRADNVLCKEIRLCPDCFLLRKKHGPATRSRAAGATKRLKLPLCLERASSPMRGRRLSKFSVWRRGGILTAGPHNHLMGIRANCCRDEAIRDVDRVPTVMTLVFDVASCCIGCVPCRLPDRYKVLDWIQASSRRDEWSCRLFRYFATRGQSTSRYPFIAPPGRFDDAFWMVI